MAVAAGVTLGALFITTNEQRKREKRVERANEQARQVDAAVRANEARRSRREQVRETRVRQANIENQAAVGGQTESSAAIAGSASLQAQLGTNVGTIGNVLSEGNIKSSAQQDIFKANRRSGLEVISGVTTNFASRFIGA